MSNSKTDNATILVIGIGNCGRNDDGLGWKFADYLGEQGIADIQIEYRYQLQVEDALLVSGFDTVLFVDASQTNLKQGFEIKPCKAAGHYFFSSHAQSPETILYLAGDLFKKMPIAYTIGIAGFNWGMGSSISHQACQNLEAAYRNFISGFLPALQPALYESV